MVMISDRLFLGASRHSVTLHHFMTSCQHSVTLRHSVTLHHFSTSCHSVTSRFCNYRTYFVAFVVWVSFQGNCTQFHWQHKVNHVGNFMERCLAARVYQSSFCKKCVFTANISILIAFLLEQTRFDHFRDPGLNTRKDGHFRDENVQDRSKHYVERVVLE